MTPNITEVASVEEFKVELREAQSVFVTSRTLDERAIQYIVTDLGVTAVFKIGFSASEAVTALCNLSSSLTGLGLFFPGQELRHRRALKVAFWECPFSSWRRSDSDRRRRRAYEIARHLTQLHKAQPQGRFELFDGQVALAAFHKASLRSQRSSLSRRYRQGAQEIARHLTQLHNARRRRSLATAPHSTRLTASAASPDRQARWRSRHRHAGNARCSAARASWRGSFAPHEASRRVLGNVNSIGEAGAQEIARHLTQLTSARTFLGRGHATGDLARRSSCKVGRVRRSQRHSSIGDAGALEIARHLTRQLTQVQLDGSVVRSTSTAFPSDAARFRAFASLSDAQRNLRLATRLEIARHLRHIRSLSGNRWLGLQPPLQGTCTSASQRSSSATTRRRRQRMEPIRASPHFLRRRTLGVPSKVRPFIT